MIDVFNDSWAITEYVSPIQRTKLFILGSSKGLRFSDNYISCMTDAEAIVKVSVIFRLRAEDIMIGVGQISIVDKYRVEVTYEEIIQAILLLPKS